MPALAPVIATIIPSSCLLIAATLPPRLTSDQSRAETDLMFTGIVERTVRVASVADGTGFVRLNLAAEFDDVKDGESIAINGVCLTVAEIAPPIVGFDVIPETLSKTNL